MSLEITSEKEKAAEILIRKAWKNIPDKETKYDPIQIILWIRNDEELSNLADFFRKKFKLDDIYEFENDIEKVLLKLDKKRLQIRKKRTTSLSDPLYILKKSMVGTSWEQAKRQIYKICRWGSEVKGLKISDSEAEEYFDRLYRNALGETPYNWERVRETGYGRLSDLTYIPLQNSYENPKQYQINYFLLKYSTGNKFDGKVTVFRGTHSPHTKIRPGDFVSFDRRFAQGFSSGKWGAVLSDELNSEDLILYKPEIGSTELVYWPKEHQIKKIAEKLPSLREFWEMYRYGI
jgi:hypothetical protein